MITSQQTPKKPPTQKPVSTNSTGRHHRFDIEHEKSIFKLQDLIKPSFSLWLLSWLLGLSTILATLGLLMVSGWFISAAALAGAAIITVVFSHALPVMLIRILAAMRTVGRYCELMVSHHAIFSLLKTLRLTFFTHMTTEPLWQQRQTLSSAQRMHRLVSDIDRLNEFVLRVVSPWLIASAASVILMVAVWFVLPLSHLIKTVLIVLIALAVVIPILWAKKSEGFAQSMATLEEERRQNLLQPLSIITQLLLWQQWQTQSHGFKSSDTRYLNQQRQEKNTQNGLTLISSWLLSASVLLVLFGTIHLLLGQTSANSINMNGISIPLLLAIVLGLLGINEVVLTLARQYLAWGKSVSAKTRLNALFTASNSFTPLNSKSNESNAKNFENKRPLPDAFTPIIAKLDNVSAKYPDAVVGAKDVNVSIKTGTPLLITGASGGGKTTLLQTLANELPLTSGAITLNGQPWQQYDWQDQLGYLGQQLDIFDQSLAINLRLGKLDASDDELRHVLNLVGLTTWLQALPDGLNTMLGEYGTLVSGGQARRIALARLLLKPRRVLLLDEPFAGLDSDTRQQVWQAIKTHQKNGLLVVVSHQKWDELTADCQLLQI